jgi:hypothetical protein
MKTTLVRTAFLFRDILHLHFEHGSLFAITMEQVGHFDDVAFGFLISNSFTTCFTFGVLRKNFVKGAF